MPVLTALDLNCPWGKATGSIILGGAPRKGAATFRVWFQVARGWSGGGEWVWRDQGKP